MNWPWNTRWSLADMSVAEEMAAAGATVSQIGVRLNASNSDIAALLVRNGIQLRPTRPEPEPPKIPYAGK